jgi:hypothetical protein
MPLLTKCCLLENTNHDEHRRVTVPWGASLALVRDAIGALARMADPAWAPG